MKNEIKQNGYHSAPNVIYEDVLSRKNRINKTLKKILKMRHIDEESKQHQP